MSKYSALDKAFMAVYAVAIIVLITDLFFWRLYGA
jgi:hypothetical protein